MKLSASEVTQLIKEAVNFWERYEANPDMDFSERREISVIQSKLSKSLIACDHSEKVKTLMGMLFVGAKTKQQLYGLLPFFISVCSQDEPQWIYGHVDWDNLPKDAQS